MNFRFKMFTLMSLFVFSVTVTFAQQNKTIAIVDAGSSGSRLYVYTLDTGTGSVDDFISEDLGMKLSDVTDPTSAGRFCNKISDHPMDQPTDLYILATAGMRYNQNSDKTYSYLEAQQLSGNYCLKKAMTISGRAEGLYAWITANKEKASLGTNTKANSATELLNTHTNGILEIGGASLQITFVPNTNVNITDTIQHPVYGVIYSKSFLGGGVNVYNNDNNKATVMNGIQTAKGFYSVFNLMARGGMPKAYLKGTGANDIRFQYVETVLNAAKLNANDTFGISEANWTKGAAYDIVINGREPEKYNNN